MFYVSYTNIWNRLNNITILQSKGLKKPSEYSVRVRLTRRICFENFETFFFYSFKFTTKIKFI